MVYPRVSHVQLLRDKRLSGQRFIWWNVWILADTVLYVLQIVQDAEQRAQRKSVTDHVLRCLAGATLAFVTKQVQKIEMIKLFCKMASSLRDSHPPQGIV